MACLALWIIGNDKKKGQKMKLQETLKRIKRIRRDITDERDISYDDTAFLQANQDIKK